MKESRLSEISASSTLAQKPIPFSRVLKYAAESRIDQVIPDISQHLRTFAVYLKNALSREGKSEYSCLGIFEIT